MREDYETQGGLPVRTRFNDILLDLPGGVSGDRTRKIVRAEWVDNQKDATQPVKITLLHQKRHSLKEEWQDADSFNLATLKTGEEVRMSFSCSQTHKLHEILGDLYEIAQSAPPTEKMTFKAFDDNAINILKPLLDEQGDNLWNILDQLHPGLTKAVVLKKMHEGHKKAVEQFKTRINDDATKESQWQKFFEQNEWIFGHGLDYRYLSKIQAQASLGGTEFNRSGEIITDFLMATKAQVGFTVLIDIKTPHTDLLGTKRYRNKAWELGEELIGGVAQVQAQCALWAEEGARQQNNLECLIKEGVFTCEPKGILIIGDTVQLENAPDKRNTFERFRRNLHNPQVITFDELLQRAELMVSQMERTPSEHEYGL